MSLPNYPSTTAFVATKVYSLDVSQRTHDSSGNVSYFDASGYCPEFRWMGINHLGFMGNVYDYQPDGGALYPLSFALMHGATIGPDGGPSYTVDNYLRQEINVTVNLVRETSFPGLIVDYLVVTKIETVCSELAPYAVSTPGQLPDSFTVTCLADGTVTTVPSGPYTGGTSTGVIANPTGASETVTAISIDLPVQPNAVYWGFGYSVNSQSPDVTPVPGAYVPQLAALGSDVCQIAGWETAFDVGGTSYPLQTNLCEGSGGSGFTTETPPALYYWNYVDVPTPPAYPVDAHPYVISAAVIADQNYYTGGYGVGLSQLRMTQFSVPFGDLTVRSRRMGSFPNSVQLTVANNTDLVHFGSEACDWMNWGGFRYLSMNLRMRGFDDSRPLPRVYVGFVPANYFYEASGSGATTLSANGSATTANIARSLLGTPVTGEAGLVTSAQGIWYEVDVTDQGTDAQAVTIDLAAPMSGSVGWWNASSGNADSGNLPTFQPSGGWPSQTCEILGRGLGDPGGRIVFQSNSVNNLGVWPPVMVVAVLNEDLGTEMVIDPRNPPVVTLTAMEFEDQGGSTLSLNIDGALSAIRSSSATSAFDVSAVPLDGNWLSLSRDDKAAMVLNRDASAGNNWHLGWPFTKDFRAGSPVYTIADLLTDLTNIPNGYDWEFTDQAYANMDTSLSTECLPRSPQFLPQSFDLGEAVDIPLAYYWAYTTFCPWELMALSAVDVPYAGSPAAVALLCIDEITGNPLTVPLTVQAALLDVHSLPQPIGGIAPVTVTPNADGYAEVQFSTSPTVQVDGAIVTFDEGLAFTGVETGRLISGFVPVVNASVGGFAEAFTHHSMAAIRVRCPRSAHVKASEPRSSLWSLSCDSRGRLTASVLGGYAPYAVQESRLVMRGSVYARGIDPALCVVEGSIQVIYRSIESGLWVTCISVDQLSTLSEEAVIFNQTGGEVAFAVDAATGSTWYVMSLRSDGLSWLTPPSASLDPNSLPHVFVLRRRDAHGNTLPFVKTPSAGLSGTLYENVVYADAVSNGRPCIEVVIPGTVIVSLGQNVYSSVDNGTTWLLNGSPVQALSNQTGGELQAGANGGTENA